MPTRNTDSSAITRLQQARAVAFGQTRQNLLTNSSNPLRAYSTTNPQSGNSNNSVMLNVINGNYTTYDKPFLLTVVSVPPTAELPFPLIPQPSVFVDPPIPIDQTVLYAFQSVLTFGTTNNYGPTVMSRFLYVWFLSVVSAWNWVQTSPQLPRTHDNWDFTVQNPLNYDDSTTWMVITVNYIMSTMSITGYNSNYLLDRTKTCHGWDSQTLASEIARIQAAGNWTGWTTAWTTWLTDRNADGYLTAKIPGPLPGSPNSQYKNGSTTLNPLLTVDPSTYTAPTQWTPLVLNGANKLYATPTWNNVRSTCLSAQDEQGLSDLAAPYFPSTPQARYADLSGMLDKTATMTDYDKLTAEWWAGGPTTSTPPGILMWYWKNYMATYNISDTQGTRAFMLSGLQVAIGLFEAGRVAWGQKLLYTQARPIQDIRRLWRGQVVTGYTGQGVSGEAWMPYQEATFVTPPFPDFVSGHSTYSAVFANTMAQWFGDDIRTDKLVTMTDLNLVTPTLSGVIETQPFGTVVFPVGSSGIQPGVVPAQATTISFTKWSDLAQSAGISRQYGGIHCMSAHLGSLAMIGDDNGVILNEMNGLYKMIKNSWSF